MSTILTTPRLILRVFTPNDLSPMAQISQDPLVMRYFPNIQDVAQTQALIERMIQHQQQYGFSLYAVENRLNQAIIGFVGLSCPTFIIPNFKPLATPVVEIGWRLAASYWGKGLATEAAQAVKQYAFETLALPELVSFTATQNKPSIRVMQKIGLQYLQEFEHPNLPPSSPIYKHVLYHLSREAYLAQASE